MGDANKISAGTFSAAPKWIYQKKKMWKAEVFAWNQGLAFFFLPKAQLHFFVHVKCNNCFVRVWEKQRAFSPASCICREWKHRSSAGCHGGVGWGALCSGLQFWPCWGSPRRYLGAWQSSGVQEEGGRREYLILSRDMWGKEGERAPAFSGCSRMWMYYLGQLTLFESFPSPHSVQSTPDCSWLPEQLMHMCPVPFPVIPSTSLACWLSLILSFHQICWGPLVRQGPGQPRGVRHRLSPGGDQLLGNEFHSVVESMTLDPSVKWLRWGRWARIWVLGMAMSHPFSTMRRTEHFRQRGSLDQRHRMLRNS